MKKYILSFLAAGFAATASLAQIPNAGFESWTSMGSYENPDSWATLNDYTSGASVYTATKGTPGSPGNSYLKLTSKTVGPAVVPGVAVCGQINTSTQQAEGGFPFTGQPQAFTGKWQHMIYGSSQGSVNVTLTRWDATSNSRVVVATANQTLSGMAMSWANFSIPFTYVDAQAPDTCIIVLRASGANPTNNDYLWVDNLAFSGNVAGLNENTVFTGMQVYPNPASSVLTIEVNSTETNAVNYEIVGLNGAVLTRGTTTIENGKNTISVDVSELNTGSYLIRFGNDSQQAVMSFKVVK